MTNQIKTIPGYRIQPKLPVGIVFAAGACHAAGFAEYPDGKTYVEALCRFGALNTPYDLLLTIEQALAADIVERVE